MSDLKYSPQEICKRGDAWYESKIRQEVEAPTNIGKILAIDVESGDYEMDDDHLTTILRAQAKNPNAVLYGMRIGYPALAKMGGGWGRSH